MNRSRILDMLADTLARSKHHPLGVAGLMLMSEAEAGRHCVQPGDAEPFDFPRADWVYPAVVSVDGAEVRITAILASRPGNGAFRRLVANIRAAGLSPVVVEPVGTAMPAIMKRWAWRGRRRGRGINTVWEWRPAQVSEGIASAEHLGEAARMPDAGPGMNPESSTDPVPYVNKNKIMAPPDPVAHPVGTPAPLTTDAEPSASGKA